MRMQVTITAKAADAHTTDQLLGRQLIEAEELSRFMTDNWSAYLMDAMRHDAWGSLSIDIRPASRNCTGGDVMLWKRSETELRRGRVGRGGWQKPVAPPSSAKRPGGLPPKPPVTVVVRREPK